MGMGSIHHGLALLNVTRERLPNRPEHPLTAMYRCVAATLVGSE